jgi:hypothetical protein
LFTPGEPEWRQRNRSRGQVLLDPAVVAMLQRYAERLGVQPTPFDASAS